MSKVSGDYRGDNGLDRLEDPRQVAVRKLLVSTVPCRLTPTLAEETKTPKEQWRVV